uniref:Post-GPI attachment to proteins factor 3 n=1 Tax=Alexandrium catenella TaxID=2925 RepID=A0A7S1S6B1_ALECA|mmetsp:Transcript_87563/g.232447  ORF Transcript_87563/g.232447 Transcript_87563/m.232447 type:complete len:235 (+) Transcript_87563:72-776(+)
MPSDGLVRRSVACPPDKRSLDVPGAARKVQRKEGGRFWQEIFNAATMLLPSIYVLSCSHAAASRARFPEGVWVTALATYAHCIASVIFHLECARRDRWDWDFDHFRSPFRVLDLTFIHASCVAYGFALSRGDTLFNVVCFLANLACVARLHWRLMRRLPGTPADSHRIVGNIAVYTMPMLMRGDLANYCCLMLCYGLSGVFWTLNERLCGWGHGLFHVMLLPCAHYVLQSATLA